MRLVLIPALVFALAQDANQAEKLFRSGEKKVSEADTVHISVDSTLDSSKGKAKLKGTVSLAKGNKARVDLTGEFLDKPFKLLLVSDGTKSKAEISLAKAGEPKDTPKNFNALIAGGVSRMGVIGSVMMARSNKPGEKEPELDDQFKVSDFTLGKKEKVGGREAQIIDYKITMERETINAQVWLDSETKLPLKRVLTVAQGNDRGTITEIYEVRVNGKIDAKKFELPK
jgi:outer membrane lipoprotein-sorting protein